jgi:hypothetical protein
MLRLCRLLPRTPADINWLLSIMFVGYEKLKLDQLGPIFECAMRMHKSGCSSCGQSITIVCILAYTSNEKMSSFILPSPNGVMPGLFERVHELDVKRVFEEESAPPSCRACDGRNDRCNNALKVSPI